MERGERKARETGEMGAFKANGILFWRGTVAHWYNFETLTNSPPQVNFLIVTSVFTIFIMAYTEGTVRFMPRRTFLSPSSLINFHDPSLRNWHLPMLGEGGQGGRK